jgi:hypothetical protein
MSPNSRRYFLPRIGGHPLSDDPLTIKATSNSASNPLPTGDREHAVVFIISDDGNPPSR